MDDHPYPRSLSHLGITVPEVSEAAQWYVDVFGFDVVRGPLTATRDDSTAWARTTDLVGEIKSITVAYLATGSSVGIELLSFDDPVECDLGPVRTGLSHLSVVDPDIEDLAARIADRGGTHDSDIWELGDTGEYVTYTRDPYDNPIEIYTQGFERIHTRRALG